MHCLNTNQHTIMRTAHYNIEMSIQLEVEQYERDCRVREWESEQEAKRERARADWWKAWEVKVLAKRAGFRCIQSAPKHAGDLCLTDLDDLEF